MENCYRHPGTAASTTCVACNQPICTECREEVAGHPMCQPCVIAAEARLSQEESSRAVEAPADALLPAAAGSSATTNDGITMDPPGAEATSTASVLEFVGEPPGLGRRVLRGIGWGALYGQCWFIWMIVFNIIFHFSDVNGVVIAVMVFFAIIAAFFGSLTGLAIGASNASVNTGTLIGVGFSVVVCLLRMALEQRFSPFSLVFYYYIGRYIGAGITRRVQRPILPKGYLPGTQLADQVVAAQDRTSAV